VNDAAGLGDFLGNLGHRLIKEGVSLSALARSLLADTGEDEEIFVQVGIDVANLGRELLMAKNQLCSACMTKTVEKFTCDNASEGETP